MSSKADGKVVRNVRKSEIVVNFEPESVAAPFPLRCGALLIDYIVILVFPIGSLLLSRYFGNDGAKLMAGSLNDAGWLIALLLAATNFVLLPAFSGQSIGKLVTGIKIVGADGSQAGISKIVLRNLVGYLVTLASLGIGFLLSALTGSGRALHDYLFGTVVIYADRKYR